MEREPHQNNASKVKDGTEFGKKLAEDLYYLLRHEARECPNCGHNLELMMVRADDGTVEQEVFYCWTCEHAEDLFDESTDGDGFNDAERL